MRERSTRNREGELQQVSDGRQRRIKVWCFGTGAMLQLSRKKADMTPSKASKQKACFAWGYHMAQCWRASLPAPPPFAGALRLPDVPSTHFCFVFIVKL